MPGNYWQKAYELQRVYNEKLARLDGETINQVTGRYMTLVSSLNDQITELSRLQNLTPEQIRKTEVYRGYIRDLNERMRSFGVYTEGVISVKQEIYIQLGLQMTQKTISLVGVEFQRLNVQALDWMIGNSLEGGRLYDLLARSYPATVEKITTTLIESVAKGRNPMETARLIKEDMAGNLSRALRVARTETMMAYREASRLQMATSGLVKEWERVEQDDACDFCKSENGKRYPVETVFETHPNCRGTMVPVIR